MIDKITNILKQKPLIIPQSLFYNYKKLNINEQDLLVLIFLLNSEETFNPMLISSNMQIKIDEVMKSINNLINQKLIEIDTIKVNKIKEVTNLNKLYEKLALLLSNENKENNKDIYKKFEEELGRTLAPTEVTMIADLKENYSEELILYALKNAVINGARNLRYIDSTLKNWKTSGYKTKEDVENNQKKFKQERKPEIIDYDWLNES